jgi:hypothetical protein
VCLLNKKGPEGKLGNEFASVHNEIRKNHENCAFEWCDYNNDCKSKENVMHVCKQLIEFVTQSKPFNYCIADASPIKLMREMSLNSDYIQASIPLISAS